MKALLGFLRRLWKAEAFSPAGLVLRAILITVLLCASELLGLREYTTFLSGTSANVNLSWHTASLLGLIHLLLYVAFILLVPILLIAAGSARGLEPLERPAPGCGAGPSPSPLKVKWTPKPVAHFRLEHEPALSRPCSHETVLLPRRQLDPRSGHCCRPVAAARLLHPCD